MSSEAVIRHSESPVRIVRRARVVPAEQPRQFRRLDVFVKISETCNIACTYCYYYEGGDDSHLNHPAYMSAETIANMAAFLERSIKVSGVEELVINFHGGEPMMMQKWRFDEMCQTLRDRLQPLVNVSFGMQTNAMLIDEEWIALIGRHDVSMGLSLDGPPEYHDEFRVDHKGRGTYERTLKGIRLLQSAFANGQIKQGFGLICVVDERRDARRTLDHFVDVVGIKNVFFALPMHSHDDLDPARVPAFTKYLCDVFDAWVERNDREIRVRFIDHMLGLVMAGEKGLEIRESSKRNSTMFTIASNGELGCQDEERTLRPDLFAQGVAANGEVSLADFYALPVVDEYLKDKDTLAPPCTKCTWQRVCDGGYELSGNAQRFSREAGFANASVYCQTIQALLTKMVKFAMSKGVPFSQIERSLVNVR